MCVCVCVYVRVCSGCRGRGCVCGKCRVGGDEVGEVRGGATFSEWRVLCIVCVVHGVCQD